MQTSYLLNICACILFFYGCAKDPEPNLLQIMRPELLPKGAISGQIKDFQGNPLLGVQTVTDSGYSGISNSDGSFIILELPKGDYTLSFLRYGFIDTSLYINNLEINEIRQLRETLFLRYGLSNVSGQVFTSDGVPVPNATVVLTDHPFSTMTNADGSFSIQKVSADVSRIIAAKDDVGWGQALLQLNPGDDFNVTIHLYQGRTGIIKGTVFKSDNTPDTGAIVSAINGAFIDTAEDGTYLIDNIPCAMPVIISSGPTRMVSGILIPENEPVINVDLKELQVIRSGNLSLYERQLFTLESDSIRIFADVRLNGENIPNYDSVAAFLWRISDGDTSFDTCTSDPFLSIVPSSEREYQYGIITIFGDTICCTPITIIQTPSNSSITFAENSFYPTGTTITETDSVTLSWKAFDMNGRPLEYSIYFGSSNTNPPSFYQSGIVDTFFRVKPPEGWLERSYLWQIEAKSTRTTLKSQINMFTRDTLTQTPIYR